MEIYFVPYSFFGNDMKHCHNILKFNSIILNFQKALVNEMHLSTSNIDNTSHLDLPNIKKYLLDGDYARLFLADLTLRYLKSVTALLSLVTFLLINMTKLEYAEKPSFIIPK